MYQTLSNIFTMTYDSTKKIICRILKQTLFEFAQIVIKFIRNILKIIKESVPTAINHLPASNEVKLE